MEALETQIPAVWKKDGCWCPHEIEETLPWLATCFSAWSLLKTAPQWPSLDLYNHHVVMRGIRNQHGHLITFIPQPSKRFLRKNKHQIPSYNEWISTEGNVLTRHENWHDFFNMLVWTTLPQTKVALHARQYGESLEHPAITVQGRTPAQDLLTRLDEGGVALFCSPQLYALLQCETLRYILWGLWLPSATSPVPQTLVFSDQHEAKVHWLKHYNAVEVSSQIEPSSTSCYPSSPLSAEEAWHWIVSGEFFSRLQFCFVGHGLFEVMLAKRWDVRAGAFLYVRPTSWFETAPEHHTAEMDQTCAQSIRDRSVESQVPCVGIPLGILDHMMRNGKVPKA